MALKSKNMRKNWKKGLRKSRRTKLYKRPSPSRVHMFRRSGVKIAITNSGTVGAVSTSGPISVGSVSADSFGYQFGASLIFNLSNVELPGDMTQLYDRYKISGVKVKIIPLSNTAGVGGLAYLPIVHGFADYDDANVPSETLIRQRGIKARRLDKPVSFFLKPRVNTMLQPGPQNLITTGYNFPTAGITKAPYINCAYPDIYHYGLKLYFRNVDLRNISAVATAFNVETTYYLCMKDPQ